MGESYTKREEPTEGFSSTELGHRASRGDSVSPGLGEQNAPEMAAQTDIPAVSDPTRYTMKGEYARGGVGRVLVAVDRAFGREVAVKELLGAGETLPPMEYDPYAPPPSVLPPPDAVTIERFLREARTAGKLEHPSIVPVYEIGQRVDQTWYYTMKLVRGETMAERLRTIATDEKLDGRAKKAERMKLLAGFIDVCNAIAYAHAKRVLHRDLKPDNIMIGEFGETVVLDWGLARNTGQEDHVGEASDSKPRSNRLTSRLTMAGTLLGTPSYMSPEQARAELHDLDGRSDVFALGLILYEIVTGQLAYPGSDTFEIIETVARQGPPSVIDVAPDCPPELASLIARATEFDRERRLESAKSLAEELEAWRDGRTMKSYHYSTRDQLRRLVNRHRGAILTAAAAFLLLMIVGTFAMMTINEEKQSAETALAGRVEAEQKATAIHHDLRTARIGEVESAKAKFAAVDLSELIAQVDGLADAWKGQEGESPPPLVKASNSEAIQRLIASLAQAEELLSLQVSSVGGRLPNLIDDANELSSIKNLLDARASAIRLCLINTEYGLARTVYSGAWRELKRRSDVMPQAEYVPAVLRDSAKRLEVLGTSIPESEAALLLHRRNRIHGIFDDIAAGLGRAGRQSKSGMLEDYVYELLQYRDMQTVNILGDALLVHAKRAGWKGPDLTPVTSPTEQEIRTTGVSKPSGVNIPVDVAWSQPERDQITLCCQVLGRIGLGDAAAKALAPFSEVVMDRKLTIEVGLALGYTASSEAWAYIYKFKFRIGGNSTTYRATTSSHRHLPKPPLIAPFDSRAYTNRGMMRQDMGDHDGAVEDHSEAIRLDGQFSPAYSNRGLVRMERGDLHGAYSDFNQAVLLDATHYGHIYNRGLSRSYAGEFEEAIADFDASEKLAPSNHRTIYQRGKARLAMGDYAGALVDLDRAVAGEPRLAHAHSSRGLARQHLGDLPGALSDCGHALELDERDPLSFGNRGQVRRLQGDLNGAVADYERALERPWALARFGGPAEPRRVAYSAASAAGALAGQGGLEASLASAKAIGWLVLAGELGFADVAQAENDPDLKGLHGDPRWAALLATYAANAAAAVPSGG